MLIPGSPDDPPAWPVDIRSRHDPRVGGPRPRERGPAPPTGHPATVRPATTVPSMGSRLLGGPLAMVAKLASQLGDRPARHSHLVAPPGVCALLALEITTSGRPPADRSPPPGVDPTHGPRESHVGAPSHPGRASLPWLRRGRAHRREIHAPPPLTTTLAHVAQLPAGPPERHRRHRFLRRPDADLPPALRLHRSLPRPPGTRPHQCHRSPYRAVDRPADR